MQAKMVRRALKCELALLVIARRVPLLRLVRLISSPFTVTFSFFFSFSFSFVGRRNGRGSRGDVFSLPLFRAAVVASKHGVDTDVATHLNRECRDRASRSSCATFFVTSSTSEDNAVNAAVLLCVLQSSRISALLHHGAEREGKRHTAIAIIIVGVQQRPNIAEACCGKYRILRLPPHRPVGPAVEVAADNHRAGG